jgi:hypothetical protein
MLNPNLSLLQFADFGDILRDSLYRFERKPIKFEKVFMNQTTGNQHLVE